MRLLSLAPVLLLVTAAPAVPAQTVRRAPGHDHAGQFQLFGKSVAGLGDWNGDGRPEYAIGSPNAGFSSFMAGRVVVFDGATGAPDPTRTFDGRGFISSSSPCQGTSFHDRLGWAITDVADMDGDGLSELLMTRPFSADDYTLPCPSPEHGGFMIVFSNPATPPFEYTHPVALTRLGEGVARLDDDHGRPTFAVLGRPLGVQVWQQQSPGSPPSLLTTIPVPSISSAAITAVGTTANGTPRFAVFTFLNGLTVYSITGFAVASFTGGPANGFSLGKLGTGTTSKLLVGAHASNSVYVLDLNGGPAVQVGPPAGATMLGTAVGSGGDIDGDGDEDWVAAFNNGNQLLIGDAAGNTAVRPIPLGTGTGGFPPVNAGALDVIGDVTADGFADILVGATNVDSTWVYYGGPDAKLTSVGGGCSQFGGSIMPTLTLSAELVIGTAPSFALAGSTPGSFSMLFLGDLDPIGVPLTGGTCLMHLQANAALGTFFSTFTDANGAWMTAPVPIPHLLAATVSGQVATFSVVAPNPIELSNAVEMKIGW